MTEESLYSLTMNTRRASRAQFEAMLRYIEERPHMVSKPCSRSKCVEEWEQMADQLNGMLSGVTKTAFKWSRCWIDWKCSTRKKYASILQNKGDDPDVPSASLNELEIRLLPFIADSVMAGDSPLPDMDGTSTSTFLIKTPSKSTSNYEGVNLSEDEAIQDHTYVSIIKQENSRETLNQQKDGAGSPTIVKITQPKRSSQEKFVICTNLDEYCSAESNHEASEEDYIPKEKRKRRLKIKDKHVNRESRDGLKDEYQELLRMKGDNERNRLQCELKRLKLMQREIKLRECALRLKRGNRFRCSSITYPLLKF